MRRTLVLMLTGALVLALVTPVSADSHIPEGLKKVAICHFDGHEASGTFGAEDFTGDYVINFPPTATFCEATIFDLYDVEPGNMLIVSVNALDGHDVEGLNRIADYEPGWWKKK